MAEFLSVSVPRNIQQRRLYIGSNCKVLYRFDEENIEWITNHFLGQHEETRGGALRNMEKMRIYLRFVGDPGFQSGIAEDIGIHQSTVSRVISEVSAKIINHSTEWIKFPKLAEEMQIAQRKWEAKYKFPFAIGAIDCTHIRIKKPFTQSDEYINRKGYHSINVQATCDEKDMFTSVDISWPGSVHDSRIFKNSEIYSILQASNSGSVLLGDDGYGVAPWLMTPFRQPTTDAEKIYNEILIKERVVIERCFGQLKQRFPLLQYKVRVQEKILPRVVGSCFVLHNVAKYLGDKDTTMEEDNATGIEMRSNDELQPDDLQPSRIRVAGQSRRLAIANSLLVQRR